MLLWEVQENNDVTIFKDVPKDLHHAYQVRACMRALVICKASQLAGNDLQRNIHDVGQLLTF